MLVYGALYASGFLLNLYLQAIGFSPFAVGLLSRADERRPGFLGAAWGGRLADRRGPRLPLDGRAARARGRAAALLPRPTRARAGRR